MKVLFAILVIIGYYIYVGFILSEMFNWFISGIFSIKAISIAESIGIMLLFQLFILSTNKIDPKSKSDTVSLVFSPIMIYMVGFIIKTYFM